MVVVVDVNKPLLGTDHYYTSGNNDIGIVFGIFETVPLSGSSCCVNGF